MTIKRVVGKPRKFSSPEELKKVIQEYFDETPEDEITITGLSLKVGSKQLLNDYENRKGFEGIIKEAKLIVENRYEIDLKKYGRAGSIFALKNFNWRDSQHLDIKQESKVDDKQLETIRKDVQEFLDEYKK